MSRLPIGMRLTFLYTLPLVAVLAVGWMSLGRLSTIRRSLQAASEENSAAMQLAAAGMAHATETSRLVHEALLESDPRRTRELLESVETNRQRAHQIDDSIRAVLRTPEAEGAFQSVETSCDEFGRSFGRVRDLLLAGDRAAAEHLLRAEVLPQRRRVQAAWQEFIGWHRGQIQAAAAHAGKQYLEARNEIVAAVLLALAACTAAGVAGTASVVRPVSSAVRVAQRIARGDLREKVIVDRTDELGRLQTAMAGMSDRLEAVLAQVRRGSHELAQASEDIRANARWLLEHTAVQASAASEMVATLHQMSSASARTMEVNRDLRLLLDSNAPAVDDELDGCCDGHTVLRLAPASAAPSTPDALLDSAEQGVEEIWAGVARVNRTVLSVDSIARSNAMKAQDLWCTAEALSRRAATLEQTVDFFRVRSLDDPEAPAEANRHSLGDRVSPPAA